MTCVKIEYDMYTSHDAMYKLCITVSILIISISIIMIYYQLIFESTLSGKTVTQECNTGDDLKKTVTLNAVS